MQLVRFVFIFHHFGVFLRYFVKFILLRQKRGVEHEWFNFDFLDLGLR